VNFKLRRNIHLAASPPTPSMAFPSVSEWTADVLGVPTYFCVDGFADRLLIVVSQVPAFGAVLSARRGCAAVGVGGGGDALVRALLGERDDARAEQLARALLDAAAARGDARELLVAVGLRAPRGGGADGAPAGAADAALVRALLGALTARSPSPF
jgi:hypothetical protein